MVIRLYDKEGKKYLYNVNKSIGIGSTAIVYKISDDICLKYISNDCAIDYSIISKIMNMNLDNFYKIYKLLFNYNGYFSGYLMQYYKDEDVNILTMPTDYTLDNFYKIYSSIKKINDSKIFIRDLHDGNIIMNKDKITIIDIDFYDCEYETSDDNVEKNNYSALMTLFEDIYRNALIKNKSFITSEDLNAITYLFSPKEDINMVYKKIKEYKYPIDYIKCKVRDKQ